MARRPPLLRGPLGAPLLRTDLLNGPRWGRGWGGRGVPTNGDLAHNRPTMSDNATLLTVCPHCRRRYRVLARHVPPQGVRARCPHCRAVFSIIPRLTPAPAAAPRPAA